MRSADMLMIIPLRNQLHELLSHADHGLEPIGINVHARGLALTKTWRIALLVIDEKVSAISLARRRSFSGNFDVLIEVQHLKPLASPVDWGQLRQALHASDMQRLGQVYESTGIIPSATAQRVTSALELLSSGLAEDLATLRELQPRDHDPTPALVNSMEQRDAVAVALEAAGLDSLQALEGYEPSGEFPFVEGIAGIEAHESDILRHDASTFGYWKSVRTERLIDYRFVDPKNENRKVTITYADRNPLEALTGTDLIYYREETKSYVLVQYKRMTRRNGVDTPLYRPDKQLDDEIARMQELNLANPHSGNIEDIRLGGCPFFIKLVEPDMKRPEGHHLVKGMYIPLDVFQLLRQEPVAVGPRGGVTIGWEKARNRYLTNTLFVELVKDSWIGTKGDETAHLHSLIEQTLSGGRSLVLARNETRADQVGHRI